MAPEPCATLAIEDELSRHEQWVLDGFPRSARQLPSVRREPIVYLELSNRLALARAIKRGKADPRIEWHRITRQAKLLADVRTVAAVIVPVANRTPQEVLSVIIDWFEHDIHPAGKGMSS